jgi:hypothetical protein
MSEIEDALHIAERSADDFALAHAQVTLGAALVHRPTPAERDRGQQLLADVREVFLRERHHIADLPLVDVYLARETARRGDRDGAIPLMRATLDNLVRDGRLLTWGIVVTDVLVDTLLNRGAERDIAEAENAIERLATAPTEEGLIPLDIFVLRLHALLARTRGDSAAYVNLRDRYRDMARTLGFEGHLDLAGAMP